MPVSFRAPLFFEQRMPLRPQTQVFKSLQHAVVNVEKLDYEIWMNCACLLPLLFFMFCYHGDFSVARYTWPGSEATWRGRGGACNTWRISGDELHGGKTSSSSRRYEPLCLVCKWEAAWLFWIVRFESLIRFNIMFIIILHIFAKNICKHDKEENWWMPWWRGGINESTKLILSRLLRIKHRTPVEPASEITIK